MRRGKCDDRLLASSWSVCCRERLVSANVQLSREDRRPEHRDGLLPSVDPETDPLKQSTDDEELLLLRALSSLGWIIAQLKGSLNTARSSSPRTDPDERLHLAGRD